MDSVSKNFYKCYFCKENIDRYDIEEHFKTVHMFNSLDHICECCDEMFDTQNDLINHADIHADKLDSKLNSFEEGKSKFLPFMTSFICEDDAFRLLDWINENLEDLRLSIKVDLKSCNNLNYQDAGNGALTEDLSLRNVKNDVLVYEDQGEEVLSWSDNKSKFKEVETSVDQPNTTLKFEQNVESKIEEESENEQEIYGTKFHQEVIGNEKSSEKNHIYPKGHIKNELKKRQMGNQNKENLCETCGKSFCNAKSLKNHTYVVHEGHKDYKCELCNKSFSKQIFLKSHISTFHEGKKDYLCDQCEKRYSRACDLKHHIYTFHQGNKDFKCEVCGKFFNLSSGLKSHISIIHEGKKDHRCETCGKSFSQAANMKTHIHAVHENVRVQCESCGKTFFAKNDLKKHMKRVHDSQKICKKCGKPFMVEKLKLHISECPSICKTCGKSYSGLKSQEILKRHIQIVHEGSKPHKCETVNHLAYHLI